MKSRLLMFLLLIGAFGFIAMKKNTLGLGSDSSLSIIDQVKNTFNFGPDPTVFTPEALENVLTDLEGNQSTLKEVLDQHKGKTIIVDVWASWCSDCLKGLPKVAEMQASTADSDIQYLFLSVDKKESAWKRAVKRKNIKGIHYFVDGEWGSNLGDFLKLDWIPRYLVVQPDGSIGLYKATTADDPAILETAKGTVGSK